MSRTVSESGAYARSLGITHHKLLKLGGMAKLQALSPDARGVLLAPHRYGSEIVNNRIHTRQPFVWPHQRGQL